MSASPRSRAVTVLVLALPMALYGGFETLRTLSFLARAIPAQGQVVAVGSIATGGKGFPVTVSFTAATGDAVTFATSTQKPARLAVGDPVRVLYEPSDPTVAILDTPMRLWVWPGAWLGMGILFSAVGVTMLLRQGLTTRS